MLAYLKGIITYKSPATVVVECNGLGYKCNISLNTYSKIQDKEQCKLFTYLNVKSEGQSVSAFELYGFAEETEKAIFENLISVSGIGANTARMMLSSLSPEEVRAAIVGENVTVIQGIKGIGPKTAKRVILELKDKIIKVKTDDIISVPVHNTTREEALSALVSLGINKTKADQAVIKALKLSELSEITVEELIKESLKNL